MGVYTFNTSARLTALGILLNLSFNTSLIKEIHQKGGTLYILNELFQSENPEAKVSAAELLHVLMNSPSQGPGICEVMRSYLPNSVINALLAGECRNMLNWSKEQAKSKVKKEVEERFKTQQENTEIFWINHGICIDILEGAENHVEESKAGVETEAEVENTKRRRNSPAGHQKRKKSSLESMTAEGIEAVVDRVDGKEETQTLRESLSECALKLKQFRDEMPTSRDFSKLAEEVMLAKNDQANPLNVYPPDIKRNMYADIVSYAMTNMQTTVNMFLTAETDFSKYPLSEQVPQIGYQISLLLLGSSANHHHSNALARVKSVTAKSYGMSNRGLQVDSKVGHCLGREAYYFARDQHVVYGNALVQRFAAGGLATLCIDNCNWTLKNSDVQNNVTVGYASFSKGFEVGDQSDELTLTDTLKLFNPDVLDMNSEVNKEYRKVLDAIANSIIGNFIKNNGGPLFGFFKSFYPDHYEHEQCKTAHGRSQLYLQNIIPWDPNITPEMVEVLFRLQDFYLFCISCAVGEPELFRRDVEVMKDVKKSKEERISAQDSVFRICSELGLMIVTGDQLTCER